MVAMPEGGISVTSHSKLLIPSHSYLLSNLVRGAYRPLRLDGKLCSNEELGMKVAASPRVYRGAMPESSVSCKGLRFKIISPAEQPLEEGARQRRRIDVPRRGTLLRSD